MSKMEKRKAIKMVAYLNDFDADLNKWRNSFYEIWRYQMTFGFAYRIQLQESRAKGVYIVLDVKLGYKQNALDMLDNLGYQRVQTFDIKCGVFDELELDDDIDFVTED